MRQEPPREANSGCERILSYRIVGERVVSPDDSGRERTSKIGRDNISGGASRERRVGISLMDVEAEVSAQAVTKLPETLIPQTQGEGNGFTDSIVVLPIGRAFPSPILAIQQTVIVNGLIDVAEKLRAVLLRVQPEQKIRPCEKLDGRA